MPVQGTAKPQQIIDRLMERLLNRSKSMAACKLGLEPRRRRGGGCSACTAPREFDIDREIAQLIDAGAFRLPGKCPYRVIVSHLVAGLTLGPEAARARGAGDAGQVRVDPVVAIKDVRRRLGAFLFATGLARDDIEAISIGNTSPRWQALGAVLMAYRALEKALDLFQDQKAMETRRASPGRTGALHHQAIARAIALAWRQLTGRLPAKDNTKFHHLLQAAMTSVFGDRVKLPNLESTTNTAVVRIRKDGRGRS
jgi:hypothetical protein